MPIITLVSVNGYLIFGEGIDLTSFYKSYPHPANTNEWCCWNSAPQSIRSFGEISRLARQLEGYAVSVRYPSVAIEVDAAEEALQTAGSIRDLMPSKLT